MDFYTVIAGDNVRTHSPRSRHPYGQVHGFDEYPAAKRYRSELRNANPGKNFYIVHTVIETSVEGFFGHVFSEIVAVAEEDLQ